MLQTDARSRALGRVIAASTAAALVAGGVSIAAVPANAAPSPIHVQAINVGLPVVLGTVAVGSTVHATILDLEVGSLLTYQWKRNGVPITGATGPAYTPTVADYGTNLTVTIVVSLGVVQLATVTSVGATVGPGVQQNAPYPTISGTATVGSTLNGTPGPWLLDTGLFYQWYRGNTAIPGATGLDYTLTAADLGSKIHLDVRGELTGFISLTNSSNESAVVGVGTQVSTPTPYITGTNAVGNTLAVAPGSWDAGVALSYQWLRAGVAIAGATDTTYDLVPADLGALVTVEVTGTRAGYSTVTKTSAAGTAVLAGVLSPTSVPTIGGGLAVGETLTAEPGTWADGADLSYAWYRDGVAIPGATGSTYLLTVDDLGASITVAVTGELAGYVASTVVSAGSAEVQENMLPSTGIPTVTGETAVGETLTANTGTWPDGVEFSFAWQRDGVAIAGADDATYTLTAADAGKAVRVVVTGVLPGYAATSVASAATDTIDLGTLDEPGETGVTGQLVVGSTLTADAGNLPTGTVKTYQWLRGSTPIVGATASTYTLTPDDDGEQISVEIVATLAGYSPLTFTLDTTGVVSTIDIPVVGTPTIDGVATVGAILTAEPGTWSAETSFSYQWKRDGSAIGGATASTYKLAAADLDAVITVTVTGTRSGNSPVSRTSAATASVAAGTLVQVSDESLEGTLAVGQTLTADPGAWPAGTTFSYEWQADGDVIPGETDSTLVLTSDELGAAISVVITAAKSGYTSETVSATLPGTVVAQAIPATAAPTIAGVPAVGRTLTAEVGTWTGDTTFSYSWKRDGVSIPGATDSSYVLTAADEGSAITVSVTGTNAPYASVTRSSQPTDEVVEGTIAGAPVPTVAGTASVGSTLQATAGSWPVGTTLAYQWLRDGVAISGATGTTYVVAGADLGSALSVRVTGSLSGYADLARVSAATAAVIPGSTTPDPTPTPADPTPTPTPTPTDSTPTPTPTPTAPTPTTPGTPSDNAAIAQVGTPVVSGATTYQKVLSVTPGVWSADATLSYQWLRNGVAIPKANGLTYKLTVADIGKRLSVAVTGSRVGSDSVRVLSGPTAIVAAKVFKRAPAPRITGTVAVGRTLTAKVQKWHKGVRFTYQWSANGKKIAKATKSTYKVATKYAGKKLTVKITAKLSGYKTLAKVSKKTVKIAR